MKSTIYFSKPLISPSKVCVLLASLLSLSANVYADTTLFGIVPAANDISAEIPPMPGRIAAFAWQGVPKSNYVVTLNVDAEPALVVAVGAHINSTTFDGTAKTLTVDLTYDGLSILTDGAIELPENSFIVAVDPGIQASGLGTVTGCYGPGRDPSVYKDDRSDFGDDDGLTDPAPPSTVDTDLGLSSTTPGTTFSTRTFYWCVVPPTAAIPSVGFRVSAYPGTQDSTNFDVSSGVTQLLATAAGKPTNVARQFAVFSGGAQVSVQVQDSAEGGVSFAGTPRFIDGEITVDDVPFSDTPPSNTKNLTTRDIVLGSREAISFAPDSTKPKTPDLDLSGFIADPLAVGEPVEILRFENRRCTSEENSVFGSEVGAAEIGAAAIGGVVIGRDIVKPDGSYSAKVPTSAVFPNNKTNANLGSRIVTDKVQESRQINLNRQIRDNRR